MPEINSIPYEAAEDLNKYLYDEYYSTENIDPTTTGTGYLRSRIFELSNETGITQGSICMTNYNLNYFNPLYAEAVWKCYMNEMKDCFVFFGFKETLAEPTYNMVESHSGFMVNDGKLYASVANGYSQQRVQIIGIDMTRVENYKIEYNKFSIMPLPVIEETLGLPTIFSVERVWKVMVDLSGKAKFHILPSGDPSAVAGENNCSPINQVHYIVHYIKNLVNADKKIIFNRFIYKEVYAD